MEDQSQKDMPAETIQMTTFINYINNEHLRREERIRNLNKDLSDGVKLIRIVESAQKRVCNAKIYHKMQTEDQKLSNVQLALDALRQDGVRLINIGSQDIVDGNLQLTLSLIWRLIEHYHIPASGCQSTPQTKILMAWLQSVLPDFRLTNFRTNWNDGVALSALVDYCRPGLLDWRLLNLNNRYNNCKQALELAEQYLAVPMIVAPQHFCSPYLDEPSCVTYLAYFVKRNGPGYNATLQNTQKFLLDVRLLDLEKSWNDGFLLCKLVEAVGGYVPGFKNMTFDAPSQWEWNLTRALEYIYTQFGIVSLVGADSIASCHHKHMGILSMCAALTCRAATSTKSPSSQQLAVAIKQKTIYLINQPILIHFILHQNQSPSIFNSKTLQLVLIGPNGIKLSPKASQTNLQIKPRQVVLSFTPQSSGKYTAHIICEGKELSTSPITFQVEQLAEADKQPSLSMAQYSESFPLGIEQVFFSGLHQPCALGSLVEIVINAQMGGKTVKGEVTVLAFSPTGACKPCDVTYTDKSYLTGFTPTEIGEWQVHVMYNGHHIKGSPFQCHVYDSSLIEVYGLDVGSVGQQLKFTVDASKAGKGHVEVLIVRQDHQLPCHISEERGLPTNIYNVHFTPDGAGQYKIHIIFNDQEVKGSPFLLNIANASAVSVNGDCLKNAAVGKLATFFIHAVGAESKDISVNVSGPTNRIKHARVVPLDESTYKVEWKPAEAGEYLISVELFEQPVPGSPFHCNVGNPELVSVIKMPKHIDAIHLNTPHSFEIDATAAGLGNLEIFINGGLVVCRVRELAPRHFEAEFTPEQLVKHVIEMKFNGQSVLNSPWILPIREQGESAVHPQPIKQSHQDEYSELSGTGLTRAAVGGVSSFEIKSDSLKAENLLVRLTDSNSKAMNVVVIQRHGHLRCEYQLPKVGEYQLEIYINGQPIDSGPLFISAYDVQKVFIRLVGEIMLGKPVQFIVDAVEAGKGQLEISVNQGQVPNNVQMQDAGRCLVTFIPQKTGTYMIDVTFNGNQVQGCPIKVDVQSKQVGKPVSAPVFSHTTGGAGIGGTSPPPPRPPSSLDRGPSSAYFSGGSPHIDTYSSYAPSPSSTRPLGDSPRSPPLVAHVQEHQQSRNSPEEQLKSPRLVKGAAGEQSKKGLLGYTVAHYGEVEPYPGDASQKTVKTTTTTVTHKYFGEAEQPAVKPHKYFDKIEVDSSSKIPPESEWTRPFLPESETAQFEMTRSAELTLYKDRREQEPLRFQPINTRPGEQAYATVLENNKHAYAGGDKDSFKDMPLPEKIQKVTDVPYTPLEEHARRTADFMRVREEDEKILEKHGYGAYRSEQQHQPSQQQLEEVNPATPQYHAPPPTHTHVIEPYSSDIEAMTPGTRRKLLEHSVYKANDLKESEETDLESEPAGSKHSSKPTTPRLSLKFNRSDKTRDANKFDFGKSKISSKNEVVRKGKDVEVKIESLKLNKEDTLKIVVMQPTKTKTEQALELSHKLKKSRNTYEISFRPTEVGTHKVLVFVNNQFPHPQTPFPIRVYDANQIIVGEIARESVINDTVEFTVDAGRAGFGNLEMAIKDSDGCIIPSHVSQLEAGTAKFLVTFNPTSLGTHTVNITFNKEIINGSPFEVNIVQDALSFAGKSAYSAKTNGSADYSTSTLESKKKEKVKETKHKKEKTERNGSKGKGDKECKAIVTKIPSLSRVGKPAELVLSIPSTAVERLIEARVTDPEKKELAVEMFEDEPNTRRIQFTSERVGDHEIEVKLDGVKVEGSPFTCRSYDPAKIFVGNVPDGIVNKAVHFTVDASAAGVGNLEVAVNQGKIPSMAHALGQHKYDISFVPRENIDHQISVRFNNEPVPGSPFLSRLISNPSRPIITTTGPGLERISVGEQTEFWVNVQLQDATLAISPPKVQIVDARGDHIIAKISPDIQEPGNTRYLVVYSPKHVGNHQIDVKYENEAVPGSPFISKAFDASCARLSLTEEAHVGKPCTFTIDAAKAGAGNMEIIVSVGKRNVPNFVQAEGQAKFKVSFTPQEASEHVISVKFNGIPIPGSPMSCPVSGVDVSSASLPKSLASPYFKDEELESIKPEKGEDVLRLVGDLAAAQVGKTKRFSIDTPDRGKTDCNVVITGPDKSHIPVRVIKVTEGFDVEFEVPRAGDYEIDIFINKKLLDVCPIICKAISLNSGVPLEKSHQLGCGEEFLFEVDLPKLKRSEEIHAEIRTEEGKLLNCTTKLDYNNHKAKVSFRSDEKPSTYFVTIMRNGSVLEERVFFSTTTATQHMTYPARQPVEEEVRLVHFPLKALVEHAAQFELELLNQRKSGKPRVQIFDADGNAVPVSFNNPSAHNQLYVAEWQPLKEGRHQVVIQGMANPLYVDVLDLSAVSVIGLRNDCVGIQQNFKLDWSQSGGSSASVSVIHESGQPIKCHMKKAGREGLYLCSFTPPIPGLYLLTIFVDDMQLPECPYECVISQEGAVRAMGDALKRAQRGKTGRFEVSLGNSGNRGELDVIVTDFHKSPLPVRCYKQHDDSYWAEFTPEQCGTHTIEITFANVPVNGSPFQCEVVDPKRVVVKGVEEPLILKNVASISVDRKHAGNGELFFELSDPSGRKLKTDKVMTSTGADSFTFLPSKLGSHKLVVKLGGFVVPGSPFNIEVVDQGKPTVYGAALDYCVESNQQASLIFDPKKTKGGLKLDVRGPSNQKIRHSTNNRPDGTTEISFRPLEVGNYFVSLEFNNKPVSGSPFNVEVVDPVKVVINDKNVRQDGMLQLFFEERNVIDVDATAAGPGKLRAEVRDSDGKLLLDSDCQIQSLGYGKYQLIVYPSQIGNHKLYLYWSDLVVPAVYPLLCVSEKRYGKSTPQNQHREVPSKSKLASKSAEVSARGQGISNAVLKEQAEFIVNCGEGSTGKLSATLIGDKADIPVKITPLRGVVYKCTYTPLIAGKYQLNVLLDGEHIAGSPMTVDVQGHSSVADLIEVDTRTLKLGIIGEDVKTVIDARKAGPGHLSAQCVGPSQLEYCELFDNRDGTYVLRVTPKELGKHTLTIKYANEHVPGSPFSFTVSNQPDPSQVKVYGAGVEHGILHSFKSNFVVETKGAGAGQLTVRVRGPRGAFNVEMQRDRHQDRTIHCKYEPKEPGDYSIEVKWHGKHVPGSPFLVIITDTEQELQRFLFGKTPSPQPPTPFVPPGWMGHPPPHPQSPIPFGPTMAQGPGNMRGRTPHPPSHHQPIYGGRARPQHY